MFKTIFKSLFHFLIVLVLTMFLIAFHSSLLNLIWLASIKMPITISASLTMFIGDVEGLLFNGAFPVPILISMLYAITFIFTAVIRRWTVFPARVMYAVAGAFTFIIITLVLPLLVNNIDLIANARSSNGKLILIIIGAIAGLYFGSFVERSKNGK